MPQGATPCKHLQEPPLSARIYLGRYMHRVVKQEFDGKPTEHFWAGMQRDTGKQQKWLRDIYENLEALDDKRKTLNLGMSFKPTSIRVGSGKQRCSGMRAKGGGRKNHLLPIWIWG